MVTDPIKKSVQEIIKTVPQNVLLVAATKTRSPEEVKAAIAAGVSIIGYNYVQEAEQMYQHIKNIVKWHLIGHLQSNKAKRAVQIFDMIETIDSFKIANTVNRHCAEMGKIMPVLIEINSGRESSKTGVLPENTESLIREISSLVHLRILGLMTMGPRFGNPEDSRPYFKKTKVLFEHLSKADIPNVEMKHLSMGMSNSYKIAIEEGANIVRIGTKLFGER
jgi:pyridoxal phosphate enzyme (YggS family)